MHSDAVTASDSRDVAKLTHLLELEREKTAEWRARATAATDDADTLRARYDGAMEEKRVLLKQLSKAKGDLKTAEANVKTAREDARSVRAQAQAQATATAWAGAGAGSGGGGDADALAAEKAALAAENAGLVQSEALLLRSVAETSDDLTSYCNRIAQCCGNGAEGLAIPDQGADADTDADMDALKVATSALGRAVETLEQQKLQEEERVGNLRGKIAAYEAEISTLRSQAAGEDEAAAGLLEEVEAAAKESEEMRAMMEDMRVIAEQNAARAAMHEKARYEREAELAALRKERDVEAQKQQQQQERQAQGELVAAAEVKRAVEAAEARGRAMVAAEAERYEALLKELVSEEEERASQEKAQASEIEQQISDALRANDALMQQTVAELKVEYKSSIEELTSGKDALTETNRTLEATVERKNKVRAFLLRASPLHPFLPSPLAPSPSPLRETQHTQITLRPPPSYHVIR